MPELVLSTINAKWIHPSLALRLLAANLGAFESRSAILEFALRQPLVEKTGPILAARPRILALSVYIWNHAGTLELLEALEGEWLKLGSRPVVVLGGPEASALAEDAPLARRADWIVRGEGEHAFRSLCAVLLSGDRSGSGPPGGLVAAPSTGIAALSGKFIDAAPADLASIEKGYRLYSSEDLTRKLSYVEASRGCPFGCEFCLSSLDRKVRDFPLETFLSDMEELFARGASSFKFLDRSFNLDADRARRIMEFFLERLKPPAYVHFEMVPSRFPAELRSVLERFPAGTLRLEVGIQTFNPEVARIIGRPSDPEKELEALDFLRRRTTAIVHADLIAGLPGENFASFGRGFDRLWKVRPTEIQLGILKRLPGTPLCRHDGPFGMRYDAAPPYEVLETAALPAAELHRLKNFARFWELTVNRGVFDDLVPRLLPEGEGAFERFLGVSDRLLARLGRNWGIDRSELRTALEEEIQGRR